MKLLGGLVVALLAVVALALRRRHQEDRADPYLDYNYGGW